jgi:hypothetical protein
LERLRGDEEWREKQSAPFTMKRRGWEQMIHILPMSSGNPRRKSIFAWKAGAIAWGIVISIFLLYAIVPAGAQDAKAKYPSMAPLEQYRIANSADEIALARSAAPVSISGDAEVMILGSHGYETAVKGKNGFVCIVERSWAKNLDDPDFWNPKVRAPICFNAPSARSVLPHFLKRTEWVLAGVSKTEMGERIKSAIAAKTLPVPEPSAMCYMMSKQGNLSDSDGHWHPHLMFFYPRIDNSAWGANLPGSPVLADEADPEPVTVFFIPVMMWSDGTPGTD